MFYEVGRVYFPAPHEELPNERRRLGIAISGPLERIWWGGAGAVRIEFFHLKGILDALFERIGVVGHGYETVIHPAFHPGKTAAVRIGEIDLGLAGELHPDVVRNFELPEQPIIAAELDLDEMFRQRKECRYQPISPFPPAKEDLAAILAEDIPAHEIVNVVMEAGKPLVKEVVIFDVWRGKNIRAGKKSVAFSLTYQATDRVLKAGEIKRTRERIIQRLSDTLDARLRE